MELIIITGMSGAGKTVALKSLEDRGYYCVDNIPVFLIPQFAQLGLRNQDIHAFAIGVDTRVGKDLERISEVYDQLDNANIRYKTIFLDASDSVLIKRYKETRRSHPLARDGRIEDGIELERKELTWLKDKADFVIDTTNLLTKDLRVQLFEIISGKKHHYQNLVVTVMSFGFKNGLPDDADLIFDVRFLPNPFYEELLKEKTGLDPEVSGYCLDNGAGKEFLEHLYQMFDFLIPQYILEGKNQLIIGIGCTGGRHRSVAVAEALSGHLNKNPEIIVKTLHRDSMN